MSLASRPPIASSGTDAPLETATSKAVYLGRWRVPFMIAALFLLLLCGPAPHLRYLLANWPGGPADGVAILENALLAGVYACTATVAAMSAILGFPRLTLTSQGLTRRSQFRTTNVAWTSLSRFHVTHRNGGKAASAAADIIGLDASPRLRRGKGKLFKITATYRTPLEAIVAEIHDRQTARRWVFPPRSRGRRARLSCPNTELLVSGCPG